MMKKASIKKGLLRGIVAMLLFAVLIVPCRAEPDPAELDIWVEIENGGTAVIEPEADAPAPAVTTLVLAHGGTEAFHIVFPEAGIFAYTVRIEPDGRDLHFDDTVYRIVVYVNEHNGALIPSIVIYDQSSGNKYAPETGDPDRPCNILFVNEPPVLPEPTPPPWPKPTPDPKPSPEVSPEPSPEVNPEPSPEASPEPSAEVIPEPSAEPTPEPTTTPDENAPPYDDSGTPLNPDGSKDQPKTGDDSRLIDYLLLATAAAAGLFLLSIL